MIVRDIYSNSTYFSSFYFCNLLVHYDIGMILQYEYLSSTLVNNLLCRVVTIEDGTHLKLLA